MTVDYDNAPEINKAVDYDQPVEMFKGDRVVPATVISGSPISITWEGALEATSLNALMRMGWHVRNRVS